MLRKLTAMLALTGVLAAPVAFAQDTLLTETVYDEIDYTVYGPVAVGDIDYAAAGLEFGFPVGATEIRTNLDDEDLIATFRTTADLDDLASYYEELFGNLDELEPVQDVVVRDEYVTALYAYEDDVLVRWTVEQIREDVFRLVINFERA